MSLSDKNCSELRNKYSELEIVIIDEIPMASNKLLYQIHKHSDEIFNPLQQLPYGGKSVLFCEDLYQLPQVKPSFLFNKTATSESFIILDL